jgi:hypothetical protein
VDAATVYQEGKALQARVLGALEARARRLAWARLATALAALGLFGARVWGHAGSWWTPAMAALALGFVTLVLVHAAVHEGIARASAALRFHERGLARLGLAWDALPVSSARFRSAGHPFTGDLDVFGRASLMQLVDATETLSGEVHLAGLLSADDAGTWPDDVLARQRAARDLGERLSFREALATAAGVLSDERPDPAALLAWAESADRLPAVVRAVGWLMPAGTVVTLAIGPTLGLTGTATAAALGVAFAVGLLVSQRLSPTLDRVSSRESTATRWRAMLARVEGERFDAPLLVALRERLVEGGRRASEELASFERVVGFVNARHNEVFRFMIGPFLMWDVHCTWALGRWRDRNGTRLRRWLDALGELEALASLGAFAFEHPDFAWPELAAEPLLEAQALGHPLIPGGRRVGNDVVLPSRGRALVVTGSNMSGKSTLLRAVGVNAVLAFAGAPVCARALRIGPARVATSMRVDDSLEQGVSHFYAEVRRLKEILDRATSSTGARPVLFLLDEILHGTNSRERVAGACAVVRQLLAAGALGAVTTHDLGITALEGELGGVVHNAHFEEQITGDSMTFDYVLRPGIVTSSNALRLMRALGIDVPEGG